MKRSLMAIGLLAAIIAACSSSRPEGVSGCSDDYYYFERADVQREKLARVPDYIAKRIGGGTDDRTIYDYLTEAISEIPSGTTAEPRYLHVLVLSGGGQWGAYGAGFLNGWRTADEIGKQYRSTSGVEYPVQRRSDIHLVAGISTGAAQAPAAYVGSTTDAAVARSADLRLAAQYTQVNQDDLIRQRFGGEAAALFSNSIYTVDGLERQANGLVDAYFDVIARLPRTRRLYVGTVNLDRNKFTIVDLKAMVDRAQEATKPASKACVAESLLASAAVPLAFPPRFIDRSMYVDGNVRHGVFATLLFGTWKVREAMRARNLIPYVSVIINGNMSADSYRFTQPEVGNRGIAIAGAAVNNMLDQVFKDSTYQIENDLIAMFGANGTDSVSPDRINYYSRYTYVDNNVIRRSAASISECKLSIEDSNSLVFDPVFMKCLYEIGLKAGRDQAWQDFYQLPPPAARIPLR